MKIELSELQIRLVAYILGTHGSPTGRALSRKIQEQVTAQKNELQIVADVANDGPEVDLLRSFRIFPNGAHGGFELQKKVCPELWRD